MAHIRTHWDTVYRTKAEHERSWSQASPERSLALIRAAAPDHSASIVDIGGGASRLVDVLLAEGYHDLSVLDVSAEALGRSKERLGTLAEKVSWYVEDVTHWQPPRTWNVWHDRAVFHFLVDEASQDAYIRALARGTVAGSAVIIATFSLTGPERCSGLPVKRYSAHMLAARLGERFKMYAQASETHVTPFGTRQSFIYAAFKRT